jgi:hypothetical protein
MRGSNCCRCETNADRFRWRQCRGACPQSGQPRRIDSYEDIAGSLLVHASRSLGSDPQSTVGAPILADGRVWGLDGAQQRLISLALSLGSVVEDRSAAPDHLRQELQHAADAVDRALEELRETSRGIHSAILSKRGLPAALGTPARRSAIPVDLKIEARRRLPERVEVAAWYVVSELITNTVKHARASAVRVSVTESRDWLQLVVQ